MRIANWLSVAPMLLAAAGSALAAADSTPAVPVAVTFSPALEQRLARDFGAPERDVLGAAVVAAVDRALEHRAHRVALPAGIRVEVLLADVLPSHPTRRQGLANPSIDPLRSKSLGGAELSGSVRAADGQVLATLSYGHFAPDFATASPGGDPWADARVAIDRFAGQLAARLRTAR